MFTWKQGSISFSLDSCLVLYALCAFCIAQLCYLLCASCSSVMQLSFVPKFKTLPCVWKNSAEPMPNVCLENKEEPEVKGGVLLLLRKFMRLGMEGYSGFSSVF